METIDCFNAALNKPKLLIIGHARHGKDTFADLVVAKMELSFVSSSEFVGRAAIWEQWGKERYCSFSEFFEDRVNHRAIWFNAIVAYNTPNLARTGQEMMAKHDVYVGMRNPDEFHACVDKDLFDYVIWVDGSQRHPPEDKSSNGMTADMADIFIDNNGPEIDLQVAVNNLQKRLHDEGFDVNWKPMATDDETMTDESDLMEEQNTIEHGIEYPGLINPPKGDPDDMDKWIGLPLADKDPHDPPIQKTLEINSSSPTLKELKAYMGIINPPTLDKTKEEMSLEDARRFHNEALMAQCSPPQVGTAAVMARSKPSFVSNAVPQSKPSLDWEDMPEGATKVLDHGFFKVLDCMGSDNTICESARMSYGRGTKKVNNDQGLINYLVQNHHTSPLEMGEIRFHMRMPIFVMRQWVRHRTANLNEYSGRYSEMVRLFYVPKLEQICLQDKVNKQGSAEPMAEPQAGMARKTIEWASDKAFDEYEKLLRLGVSRETARIVLPLNTYTEVVWKLDISNLIKFLRLRDDDHAQWEIRQYAIMVSKAVEKHFPLVFAAYTEARNSETFTKNEIYALISGDTTCLSKSQFKRIADMRDLAL